MIFNIKNKHLGVLCTVCGWCGMSHTRHDFRQCPCSNAVFIDGGPEYIRVGASDPDSVQAIEIKPAKESK